MSLQTKHCQATLSLARCCFLSPFSIDQIVICKELLIRFARRVYLASLYVSPCSKPKVMNNLILMAHFCFILDELFSLFRPLPCKDLKSCTKAMCSVLMLLAEENPIVEPLKDLNSANKILPCLIMLVGVESI